MENRSVSTPEAILLFDTGALSMAYAAPAVIGFGWVLHFKSKAGVYVLAAQRFDMRVFKTADAVISTATKIGFKEVVFNF